MKRLRAPEVQARSVAALGLDPNLHALRSSTAMAASLRRAAGFLCPCAPSTLVQNVLGPLRGLTDDAEIERATIEATLEHLVALGDLLEYRDVADNGASGGIVLYAAPCGFVKRENGSVLLVGISSDKSSALPPELESRISYNGHVRQLNPRLSESLGDDLLQLGLTEIPHERWLREPAVESAAQHVTRLDQRLDGTGPSGEMPGLILLDPSKPVSYYRGRWVEPRTQTGRFVARRVQAYGAPIWCYVQARAGRPERCIDFPAVGSRWRGCDEAWRLQMAIDGQRKEPQRFSARASEAGVHRLELFSPIPMWAERRWTSIGRRVEPKGCLLSFDIPSTEIKEEIRYARDALWMDATNDSAPEAGEA